MMSKVPHHSTFYFSPYHVERTLGGYSSTLHINGEETLGIVYILGKCVCGTSSLSFLNEEPIGILR